MSNSILSRFRTSVLFYLGLLGVLPTLLPRPLVAKAFSQSASVSKGATVIDALKNDNYLFQIHNPTQCSWDEMKIRASMQIFGVNRKQAMQIASQLYWKFHASSAQAPVGELVISVDAIGYEGYLKKLGILLDSHSEVMDGKGDRAQEPTPEIEQGAKTLFEERTGTKWSKQMSPALLFMLERELKTAKTKLMQVPKEVAALFPLAREQSENTPLHLRYPADKWPQLRRIAEKVQSFSVEEQKLYYQMTLPSWDLNQIEQSVDAFEQLQKTIGAGKNGELDSSSSVSSHEQQIGVEVDPKLLLQLSPEQRKGLARKLAHQASFQQLKQMASHPITTLGQLLKNIVSAEHYQEQVERGIQELTQGNHSFVHKLAAGLGLGSQVSGQAGAWFFLGAVLLSPFLAPGIAMAAGVTALGLTLSSVLLSAAEFELRLEAASQSSQPEVFVQNTLAAAQAKTYVTASVFLAAVIEGAHGMRNFPMAKGWTQSLKKHFQTAWNQAALLRFKQQLSSFRTTYEQHIHSFFHEFQASLEKQQKQLETFDSKERLFEQLIQGDKELEKLSGLSKKQAETLLSLKKVAHGEAMLEQMLEALEQKIASTQNLITWLEEQLKKKLETHLDALEQAHTGKEAEAALSALEHTFSQEGLVAEMKQGIETFAKQELSLLAEPESTVSVSEESSSLPEETTPSTGGEAQAALSALDTQLLQALETIFKKLATLSRAFRKYSYEDFLRFSYQTWKQLPTEKATSFSQYLHTVKQVLEEVILIREEWSTFNQKYIEIPKIEKEENVGFAEIEIGNWKEKVIAISRRKMGKIPKIIRGYQVLDPDLFPGEPFFEPKRLQGQTSDRGSDSEFRILDYVARTLLAKEGESSFHLQGIVRLSSERYFCKACQDIIKKFTQKFPKITLELQAGPEIPLVEEGQPK